MPIDLKANVLKDEQAVKDLLASEPGASGTTDPLVDSTNALVQKTRDQSNASVSGIAQEAAGTYGLPAGNAAATPEAIARGNEDLTRVNQDALAAQRLNDRRAHMNRNFNFMFGRMLSATGDRKLAAQTAYQFALDQDQQMFQSAANQKARENAQAKTDIVNRYTQLKIQAQQKAQDEARKTALVNSMLRTFLGIAGSVGTAYALKGLGTAASAGSAVGPTAGVGSVGVPSVYDETAGLAAGTAGGTAGIGL